MATRLSNDYMTCIIADNTTYGTQQTNLSGALVMSDVVTELKYAPIITDTKVKTGTLKPKNTEKIVTGTKAQVTIKGNLCSGYDLLIKALTMDSSSPYTIQDTQPAGFTYNIYKLFIAGTDTYDLATGCVLVDFTITGESNGILQFESTWEAKAMSRAITTSITNAPSAYTAGTPFLFGNVTNTLFNSATKMNSFSMKFSKTMADDKTAFQNSMTKTAEYVYAVNGTIDVETIYNDANDPALEAAVGSQTPVTNTINLVNSSATWAFVCRCRIADFNLPDNDKGLFNGSYSLELAGDATEPLTVTVS